MDTPEKPAEKTSPKAAGALARLRGELDYLDLLLRRALLLARASRPSGDPEAFRGLVITEEAVDLLIGGAGETDSGAQPGSPLLAKLEAQIEARRQQNRGRTSAGSPPAPDSPFAAMARRCGLNETETDLILIALAPELDSRYETIYAYLQNDVTRGRPEGHLALSLLCASFEERLAARALLTPSSRLLSLRLLDLAESAYDRRPTLLRRFLKLEESALSFLLGQPLAAYAGAEIVTRGLHPPELGVAGETERKLEALTVRLGARALGGDMIQLTGKPDAPLRNAAAWLAWRLGRPLLIVDSARLREDPALEAAIVRDALLWRVLPVLPRPDGSEPPAEGARAGAAETRLLARLHKAGAHAVVLGGEDSRHCPADARLWRVAVEPPDAARRYSAWIAAGRGRISIPAARRLADMFPFGAEEARQSVELAQTMAALREPGAVPAPEGAAFDLADLAAAGRALAAPNLRRFAVSVTPRYGWDDLVLPPDRERQLRAVAGRVGNRGIVQDDWGFGEKLARGRGVAVLFSGPPGTGKTMAAEVLARALSLELFQIDLSTVVSKYIGEAEKHLSAIFSEAERSQCILFFDECDAIFGKRTEVKDAHDRYANTEVNYLLQRLEQYDGVVLLATNFQKNVDEAFLRRLHDSIDFPMPDEAARERIWRRQFPKAAPVDAGVDFAFLAEKLKLAGANIRNAALYAAFLAAEEGGRLGTIRMEHLMEGARREFQKQGKLVMASDMGGYRASDRAPDGGRKAQG